MFKLIHNNKGQQSYQGRHLGHDKGKSTTEKHARNISGQSDFLLTNILEEVSSVDESRDFEQDEQYLNDCLKAVCGSIEDVQCSEIEEYDFDDFNSIASTTSLLNINADQNYDDRKKGSNYPSKGGQPPKHLNGTLPHPAYPGKDQYTNGRRGSLCKERLSSYQKSISKVENWDQLGRSTTREDWKQVLLRAAEAGDLITVQDAVSHLGARKESLINARDIAGNTPLHRAAQGGKLQCLQWLVKHAPAQSVTLGNNDDMTPAAMATQFGQYECLAWLAEVTEARAELEKKHAFGLVHYAAQAGQQECLKYLLAYLRKDNTPLDICDSNAVTPAHLAAREGHLLCLQTLVDFNADVTVKDKDGWTAADYAFKAGHIGCAKYLAVVESCLVLSERVSNATRELTQCRQENAELRRKVQVLEDRSQTSLPCRPEALGGDQSDSSSAASVSSVKHSSSVSSRQRRPEPTNRRDGSSPDGESPKNTDNDGDSYDFPMDSHGPRLRDKFVTQRISNSDVRRHSMPDFADQSYLGSESVIVPGNKTTALPKRQLPLTPAPYSKKSAPPPPPRTTSRSSPVSRASSTAIPAGSELHPDKWRDTSRRSSTTIDGADSSIHSSRSQSPYRSDRSTGSSIETPSQSPSRSDRSTGSSVDRQSQSPYRSDKSTGSSVDTRSHSPYRSDRSTGSSVDTVIDAKATRNMDTRSRGSNSAQRNGSWSTRLLSVDRGIQQTSVSSESPFSSDSDVEHTYERREQPQATLSKESLRRIRTDVIGADNLETPLRTSKLTNQQARLSWHGISKTGKIAALPSRTAHDTTRTSHGQQAQVIWNDPHNMRANTHHGNNIMAKPDRMVDSNRPPSIASKPVKPVKPVMRTSSMNSSFAMSDDLDEGERPWYEIDDEVDL